MEERFRVLEESGWEEVLRQQKILRENGYTIICVASRMVPFCQGVDGLPVMKQGWEIVADRPQITTRARGLWDNG